MAKRIDLTEIPVKTGSGYPTPFDLPCAALARQHRLNRTSENSSLEITFQRSASALMQGGCFLRQTIGQTPRPSQS